MLGCRLGEQNETLIWVEAAGIGGGDDDLRGQGKIRRRKEGDSVCSREGKTTGLGTGSKLVTCLKMQDWKGEVGSLLVYFQTGD